MPSVGEPGAAGMTVVDEDGRESGVRVHRGGHSADVSAVADRHQWQQADCGMFGGMQRSGEPFGRDPDGFEEFRRDRVHHCPGGQSVCGHVEFDRVEDFTRSQPS